MDADGVCYLPAPDPLLLQRSRSRRVRASVASEKI